MELKQVLCMNKGDGENSYVKSAGLTEKVAAITQPIVYKAIESVLKEIYKCNPLTTKLELLLNVADLGCSSGPNTFTVMSTVIESSVKTCSDLGFCCQIPAEIQFFFNDLVGNDFNTLFKGLSVFQEKYKNNGVSYFPMAAPGSFYDRLFPKKSMHLIHSSYGIHWLSQAPKIRNERGLALNKGRIYISETSPDAVRKAYLSQFQEDFLLFLKRRSPEMVPNNGRILFIINGRKSDDPIGRECIYYFEILSKAISYLVSKGQVDEEKLDSFNLPTFIPSKEEVEDLVEKDGTFTIEFMETIEVELGDVWVNGELRAKNVRSFSEPMISHQFGEEIMDQLYDKVTKILVEDYMLGKQVTKNISIVAVLKKKDI
ncbi:hypothetical protein REPUB_Repub13aG0093400 [Reevesia pubescens]